MYSHVLLLSHSCSLYLVLLSLSLSLSLSLTVVYPFLYSFFCSFSLSLSLSLSISLSLPLSLSLSSPVSQACRCPFNTPLLVTFLPIFPLIHFLSLYISIISPCSFCATISRYLNVLVDPSWFVFCFVSMYVLLKCYSSRDTCTRMSECHFPLLCFSFFLSFLVNALPPPNFGWSFNKTRYLSQKFFDRVPRLPNLVDPPILVLHCTSRGFVCEIWDKPLPPPQQ